MNAAVDAVSRPRPITLADLQGLTGEPEADAPTAVRRITLDELAALTEETTHAP